MSKYTVHLQADLLGVGVGDDKAETDSEVAARFYLVTALLKACEAPPPLRVQAHAHGDGTLSPDKDEDMNLTTVLLTASAATGEPYQTWVERGEQFRAEHDGEDWSGLEYDEDTDTVSLVLDPEKDKQIEQAQEAVASVDDEFESLLATAEAAEDDTKKE